MLNVKIKDKGFIVMKSTRNNEFLGKLRYVADAEKQTEALNVIHFKFEARENLKRQRLARC